MQLEWFNWSQPALPQAVRWFAARFAKGAALDLSKLLVCVPGSQVRRRLLELLVEAAEERGLLLTPPEIVTPGVLPEKLYRPKHPFAGELAQQLAWVKVLQATEPKRLSVLVRNIPQADDLPAWLALGKMLADLHRELLADKFDCADVLKAGVELAAFNEVDRWKLLCDLETRYLRLLDSLAVWDIQTARKFAVEHRECQAPEPIVLVGLVDLNRVQRLMLDQVSEQVTALVFAPTRDGGKRTELFDEHGCLQPAAWRDFVLPLATEQIEIADGPADQATAVVRALARFNGKYAAEEIVVGMPDKRLAPYLRQRFEESNLPVRSAGGTPLVRTGPYQLLVQVADYLEQRRFSDLAALVRHPAVADWLLAEKVKRDWLTLFDDYYSQHLPAEVSDQWPGGGKGIGEMREIHGKVAGVLASSGGRAQPLDKWAAPIINLLTTLYPATLDAEREPDRTILAACRAIRDVLEDHQKLGPELAPDVSGAAAIRLLLRELDAVPIAAPADEAAIELVGWLELPWNDAPAMVVAGMNEGIVSPSVAGHLFLPNALRQALGLNDDQRMFARDLYVLGMLAATHSDLHLIAGRRSAENEPLVPSRLLFACDMEELPQRARRLFAPPVEAPRITLPGSVRPGQLQKSVLPVPLAEPLPEPVQSLRVTEFRDYLACPYRYYLKHRLHLFALADSAEELDGGQFGVLLHDALQQFATSEAVDSIDPAAIHDQLYISLGELAARRFGEAPQPAVRVQIEMLKLRLEQFAERQAQWRKEGWRIKAVERNFGGQDAPFIVDGEPIYLHGRIDRIDHNENTGAWAVLDYKSSDGGHSPDKVHRSKDGWIDLQLPLYRHLARGLGGEFPIAGQLQLGYVLLPKDPSKAKFELAAWTPEQLEDADRVAAEIVRNIRRGVFGPPTVPAPAFFEDFAAICQDDQFGAAVLPTDESDDEATA